MGTCKNCSAPVSGNYCAECGQRTDTHRIDWHWLVHEVQHSIFHVDKGLFHTLKELFVRPGHAIREFLEGRRVQHFRPVALVMVLAAVYSFGSILLQPDYEDLRMDDATKQSFQQASGTVMKYYALFELGSIPVFAFLSWLLMRRFGHNFVEHLVINTFLAGQRIAVNIIGLPFNLIGFKAALAFTSFAYMAYLAYYLLGFAQLYAQRSGSGRFLRPLATFILFWCLIFFVIIAWAIAAALANAKAGATLP